ncbi:Uncharacterized conserved protein [Phaffia rhodozyma]|uniref:Mitochondrial fission process protein 1 n=1 Tax=Phaffia rhodozyma TaxID=264483 RepID=A0A0F7SEE1_PHARH|nr:Uncharacterized conserved protein [Phaffia rhodozyma]
MSTNTDKIVKAAEDYKKAGEAKIQQGEKAAEGKLDDLVKEDFDTTDSDLRYAAYGNRLRTALRAGTRYVAYTSDVGESFRPVVPPWVVTAGYGVSWAYLIGDVSYETYKAKKHGPNALEAANFSETTRLSLLASKRAVFQGVASMALPAFTIHTVVKQSGRLFVNVKNPRLKTWGPTLTGLAVVPLLPYLFDEPVEHATDYAWKKLEGYLASAPPSGSVPELKKEL